MVRASLAALRLILTTKASVWFSQEGKEKETTVFGRMWEGMEMRSRWECLQE